MKPEKDKVLKLNRSLYGLPESPRAWNETFDEFALRNGLTRSLSDACLYVSEHVKLVIFVDDVLLMGGDQHVRRIVDKMKEEFNAKDLGNLKTFLGINIMYERDSLKLNQTPLIDRIIDRFGLADSFPYATRSFRLDLSTALKSFDI